MHSAILHFQYLHPKNQRRGGRNKKQIVYFTCEVSALRHQHDQFTAILQPFCILAKDDVAQGYANPRNWWPQKFSASRWVYLILSATYPTLPAWHRTERLRPQRTEDHHSTPEINKCERKSIVSRVIWQISYIRYHLGENMSMKGKLEHHKWVKCRSMHRVIQVGHNKHKFFHILERYSFRQARKNISGCKLVIIHGYKSENMQAPSRGKRLKTVENFMTIKLVPPLWQPTTA